MRAPTRSLLTAFILSLAACSSGTTYVVRSREPAPAPPPPPPRVVQQPVVEPLEVVIGRPVRGQLLIQTSRPAYVAIFDIVPERGVTMIRPSAYQRQRRFVVSGLSAIPVWWSPGIQSVPNATRGAADRPQASRFVYAIASDVPLRLPDDQKRTSRYSLRTLVSPHPH